MVKTTKIMSGRALRKLLFGAQFLVSLSMGAQDISYSFHAAQTTGEVGSKFGWAMTGAGDRVVVGLPFSDGQNGAVAVYIVADLADPMAGPDTVITSSGAMLFGVTIAGDQDHLAVSNCSLIENNENTTYCTQEGDHVSIYALNGSTWQEQGAVMKPLGAAGVGFGSSLALSGDRLAVGGAKSMSGGELLDVVYLYQGIGQQTSPEPVDTLYGTSPDDGFGTALAMEAGILLVGAPGDDELGADAGAVYVFDQDHGGADNWGQLRKLLASDGQAGDHFGRSMVVRGPRALVGAPDRTLAGIAAGAAYIFERDLGFENNWGEASVLDPEPSAAQAGMAFGSAVALGPDRAAVGAPLADVSGENDGWVELFKPSNDGWVRTQRIVPVLDGAVNAYSRSATTLLFQGDDLLIGAPWAKVAPFLLDPTGGVLVYRPTVVNVPEVDRKRPSVWPNPFQNALHIRYGSVPPTTTVVQLLDMQGRVVLERMLQPGGGELILAEPTLMPGCYGLRLFDGASRSSIGNISVIKL